MLKYKSSIVTSLAEISFNPKFPLKHTLIQQRCCFAFAITISFFVVAGAEIATAEEMGNINNSAPSNSPSASSVNENFELNIDSERIIEQDYKSSTSIRFGEDSPRSLSLQIGSVVRAKAINMHLQNIHGQVHFRGTWEPILQNLRSRRGIFGSQSNQ